MDMERYVKPWSKEEQGFYEANKKDIETMMKDIDWQKGTRSVTYSGRKIKTTKFTENF